MSSLVFLFLSSFFLLFFFFSLFLLLPFPSSLYWDIEITVFKINTASSVNFHYCDQFKPWQYQVLDEKSLAELTFFFYLFICFFTVCFLNENNKNCTETVLQLANLVYKHNMWCLTSQKAESIHTVQLRCYYFVVPSCLLSPSSLSPFSFSLSYSSSS